MRYTVNGCFHSASPTGFERSPWIVQPDIAALDEEMRPMKVVIVDEGHPSSESRVGGAPVNPVEALLAMLVGGMRLSRKYKLHAAARCIQKPQEPVMIVENQLRPFVLRETPRETDRQSRRIQQSAGCRHLGSSGRLVLYPVLARVLTNERQ